MCYIYVQPKYSGTMILATPEQKEVVEDAFDMFSHAGSYFNYDYYSTDKLVVIMHVATGSVYIIHRETGTIQKVCMTEELKVAIFTETGYCDLPINWKNETKKLFSKTNWDHIDVEKLMNNVRTFI